MLRVFSLCQSWNHYEKPMKEFLNVAMERNKSGDTVRVKWFVERFPRATKLVVKQLGAKPFHIRGPLNSSALDSVMCTVIENIDRLPADLAARFEELTKDEGFRQTTFYGTSDVSALRERFELASKYLIKK